MRHVYLLLWRLLKGKAWLYAVVLLCLTATSVIGTLTVFVYRRIYDDAIQAGVYSLLLPLCLLLLGIYVAMMALNMVSAYISNYVITIGQNRLREHLVEIAIEAEPRKLAGFQLGQIAGRLQEDIAVTVGSVSAMFGIMFSSSVTIVSVLGTLLYLDWRLLLFLLLLVVGPFAVLQLMQSRVERAAHQMRNVNATVMHRVMDILFGLRDLRLLPGRRGLTNMLYEDHQALLQVNLKMALIEQLGGGLANVSAVFVSIAILGYGGYLVIVQQMTMGTLLAAVALSSRLLGAINALAGFRILQFTVRPSCQRLLQIIELNQEHSKSGDTNDDAAAGEGMLVQVSNLAVVREGRHILRNCFLTIDRGQFYLLTGASGAGKTTLGAVMAGCSAIDEGRVLLNGISIDNLSVGAIVRAVALVPQKPHLFTASLKMNLCCGEPRGVCLSEDVACQTAMVVEIAEKLPGGWETQVGSGGVQLSGGEIGRVALARALRSSPQILILDETLTSVSRTAAAEIIRRLRKNYPDMSIILMTHQLPDLRFPHVHWHLQEGILQQERQHVKAQPPACVL